MPNLQPPGGENTPPMVVPAPDEGPGSSPDAFGGTPFSDDGAADALPSDGPPNATADAKPNETQAQTLDRLFGELRKQPDADKARSIAAQIERQWRRSGSATVDLLMQRAAKAMADQNNAAALDVLDQTIVLDPAYAEAWNRRATLNFTMNKFGKSLADIEQTLAREPRHWGALMGLGMILEHLDENQKAFDTYMKVLAIYPALKSAQDAAGRLADELTGPVI
ncbi:hypothetical protein LQ948_08620 [Jiella sp. MQZ9-1]|uniref:Tetratricopeptide repeat protein n=1 Tax=Jiella flava TaxID=2816857 RepID=A0A939G0T8_9HYPH|nr:tetratricopeptide repeat protein [Jiella flava]MBO0662969.1 hypothetical protein [Jiella flava]MCD2471271.1 hypothetical protein [Jiella flava]